MLAQNFKTAEDLGITDEELSAAIGVLGMMERGELTHVSKEGFESWDDLDLTLPHGFNMECSGVSTECGTVACIGGWMAVFMGRKGAAVNRYVNRVHSHSLYELFWGRASAKVSVDQAATALRSYLTTGDARWDLAAPR